MKKEWQKPVMAVLERSHAEEAVLTGCKDSETYTVGGPNNYDGKCLAPSACAICSALSYS